MHCVVQTCSAWYASCGWEQNAMAVVLLVLNIAMHPPSVSLL